MSLASRYREGSGLKNESTIFRSVESFYEQDSDHMPLKVLCLTLSESCLRRVSVLTEGKSEEFPYLGQFASIKVKEGGGIFTLVISLPRRK